LTSILNFHDFTILKRHKRKETAEKEPKKIRMKIEKDTYIFSPPKSIYDMMRAVSDGISLSC
jgi:hypothetical protein